MMTCHECGKQFQNNSNDKRCKPCIAPYEAIAIWARNSVTRAIKRGELLRLSEVHVACVDCGEKADRYDHRDYLKPLDVEPVCHRCNLKRGPALPCLSRVSDPTLVAKCNTASERRESMLRSIYGAAA